MRRHFISATAASLTLAASLLIAAPAGAHTAAAGPSRTPAHAQTVSSHGQASKLRAGAQVRAGGWDLASEMTRLSSEVRVAVNVIAVPASTPAASEAAPETAAASMGLAPSFARHNQRVELAVSVAPSQS